MDPYKKVTIDNRVASKQKYIKNFNKYNNLIDKKGFTLLFNIFVEFQNFNRKMIGTEVMSHFHYMNDRCEFKEDAREKLISTVNVKFRYIYNDPNNNPKVHFNFYLKLLKQFLKIYDLREYNLLCYNAVDKIIEDIKQLANITLLKIMCKDTTNIIMNYLYT